MLTATPDCVIVVLFKGRWKCTTASSSITFFTNTRMRISPTITTGWRVKSWKHGPQSVGEGQAQRRPSQPGILGQVRKATEGEGQGAASTAFLSKAHPTKHHREGREMSEWKPPEPDERPDGYECIIWHRGRWMHVKWVERFGGWMFGYGSGHCLDTPDRLYRPLPDDTPEHDFWEH